MVLVWEVHFLLLDLVCESLLQLYFVSFIACVPFTHSLFVPPIPSIPAALDTRAKDLEEIKQLTGEIGMQAKTRVSEVQTSRNVIAAHKGTPSVSSMGSVVDMAP